MFTNKETREGKLQIEQLEKELATLEYKNRFKRAVLSTIYGLITVAAISVLVATLWMPILKIYGSSMTPSLNEGDLVVAIKSSKYDKGDIVGLYYGNKLLVKRVVAGPGDIVDFDYDGNVYVNNKLLDEEYIKDKSYGDISIKLPYQVPDNKWFVLGDYRSTSIDSRNKVIGAISDEQVVGRIVYRIWPIETIGRIK